MEELIALAVTVLLGAFAVLSFIVAEAAKRDR